MVNKIDVFYSDRIVGTLARLKNKYAFEYNEEWIKNGFSFSPFSLPLKQGVFVPDDMTFNGFFGVFADNKDDHLKNFSFLYDEDTKTYRLSPAYDMTYSNTYYGEHTTSINHKGKNIDLNDLLIVGVKSGLDKNYCMNKAKMIKEIVDKKLSKYFK